MNEIERHEHDVLVIGAGGAGLRAAIAAEVEGASVGVVCKSLLGKAHTVMAEGGIAAALATVREEDGPRVHFRDTMRGGKGLNDWRMARIHAHEAPARVKELEAWGALFDRTEDGRILQRPFGGHTYARLAHVGDRTGLEMIRTLQDRAVHAGVSVYMECTVVALLRAGDRVAGAVAYWRDSGEFVLFPAKAVVLATGGAGEAWKINTNSWEYTGDGLYIAHRAGADLMGMEFVQFHPTGMVWPPSVRGTLVTEGVRGEGGVLRNSDGERFMFRNIPDAFSADYADTEAEADAWAEGEREENRPPPELLTRDVVSQAIMREVEEGRGSPHGGVYLDIASKRSPDYIRKKLPGMYHQFRELADVDITRDPMEVGPTTHYMMGGIKVDAETGESTLPGLFAAGEVAAGLHGGNRLGGNSLSDLLVFGERAGTAAAERAREADGFPGIEQEEARRIVDWARAPFDRDGGENPYALHEELQDLMQQKVGIARTEEGLGEALDHLAELRRRLDDVGLSGPAAYHPGWNKWIALHSLLFVSEAVTRAALKRPESRGAHTRLDHPDSDPGLDGVNLVVRREDGEIALARERVPEPPDEMRRLVEGELVREKG